MFTLRSIVVLLMQIGKTLINIEKRLMFLHDISKENNDSGFLGVTKEDQEYFLQRNKEYNSICSKILNG